MSDSSEKPAPPPSEKPAAPPEKPASEAPRATPAATALTVEPSNSWQRGLHSLWTLIMRLALLGVSISLGWIVGVLVAQVFPARNPEPPLQEVIMRRSSQTVRKVRQLPQWWRGEATLPPPPAPTTSETASNGTTTEPTAPAAPPPLLSEAQTTRLESELPALQQDLDTLEARLSALESQVGQPAAGSVEARLRRLEQRYLQPQAPAQQETTAPAAEAPADIVPGETADSETATAPVTVYQEPRFSLVTDRVVLPSSLLFEPEDSLLTPAGEQLLNTVVPDLRRYPGATLLIGSHAAGTDSAATYRELTFQQSLAVQQYLAQQLGDDVRWVVIGYGNTRPRIQGGTAAEQQRNQRVEIGIVPN